MLHVHRQYSSGTSFIFVHLFFKYIFCTDSFFLNLPVHLPLLLFLSYPLVGAGAGAHLLDALSSFPDRRFRRRDRRSAGPVATGAFALWFVTLCSNIQLHSGEVFPVIDWIPTCFSGRFSNEK